MRATLGILGIAIGLGASAVGIVLLVRGVLRHDAGALRAGRACIFVVLAGALVAVAAMEWALLTHDFSIKYVAENNARSTPTLFTITGLWAALEGSILLWAVILAGYLAFTAHRFRRRLTDPMVGWALIVGLTVALFFFLFMAVAANPFTVVQGIAPLDGRGPNPLLQNHPLMAFHPPMLYLGYVGFTIPFSFAMAALITGRFGEGWLADTRRTTLVAWGFLTVGIILGAWWSYEVLGWGGYWGWDPVENASLLPWITGTAFIHSVMVQERRGMLRVWNLSLVIATFALTILGTFLTRSGIITSVHAFSQSSIGPWLLSFLFIVMATGIGLIAWRADTLHAPGRIDSPVSREAAFLANNLLFAGLAFVVLLGTVFPLLAEAIRGSTLSVGAPYFDRMTAPLGLLLLFLMALAPALPWRATSGEVLQNRLLVPAYVGATTMVFTLIVWTRDWSTVVGFGLAAFAVAAITRVTFVAVRARRRADATGWGRALSRTVAGNPRRYGGLVVHTGVVAIAVALAASGSFGIKREVRLTQGQSATVGGYTVTYERMRTDATAQKSSVSVDLAIVRDGERLGTYAPAISSYRNANQGIGTPSVRTGVFEDLYLTLVSSRSGRGRVTVGIQVQSMTVWIWIGGGLMALGTVIALAPHVRRRRVVPPAPGGLASDGPASGELVGSERS
ncbi:MAG: heme lyase CcmF/NrfE family subunit [Acidimicrobiia bacterium]|nr:heme lyase CcmF/NrfE family subunit [Acidimicrobiia bacterium]